MLQQRRLRLQLILPPLEFPPGGLTGEARFHGPARMPGRAGRRVTGSSTSAAGIGQGSFRRAGR